jgi:hypothetical protein
MPEMMGAKRSLRTSVAIYGARIATAQSKAYAVPPIDSPRAAAMRPVAEIRSVAHASIWLASELFSPF